MRSSTKIIGTHTESDRLSERLRKPSQAETPQIAEEEDFSLYKHRKAVSLTATDVWQKKKKGRYKHKHAQTQNVQTTAYPNSSKRTHTKTRNDNNEGKTSTTSRELASTPGPCVVRFPSPRSARRHSRTALEEERKNNAYSLYPPQQQMLRSNYNPTGSSITLALPPAVNLPSTHTRTLTVMSTRTTRRRRHRTASPHRLPTLNQETPARPLTTRRPPSSPTTIPPTRREELPLRCRCLRFPLSPAGKWRYYPMVTKNTTNWAASKIQSPFARIGRRG